MPTDHSKRQRIKVEDCWNRIGVWGTQAERCEKLKEVVHCRNCSVFITAGRMLLNRELPDDYQNELSEVKLSGHAEVEKNNSVVIFRLGNEWFALPAVLFQEVVERRDIHSIPHNRSHVLRGVVAIRGELRICVSLGPILGVDKGSYRGDDVYDSVYERMVVLKHEGVQYVCPVSEIRDICQYATHDLKPPPVTAKESEVNCVTGILEWKGRRVSCLDNAELFTAIGNMLR